MLLENGIENLCNSLVSFGFHQSANDYSLFVRKENNSIIVLLVYVDDIIINDNNLDELKKVK